MSLEIGVVLAALTDRVLVLEGNVSPAGNVVQYDGQILNTYPSRVTDLVDLGIPWMEGTDRKIAAAVPLEVCPQPVWDCVFYYPPNLSITSDDALAFAGKRSSFITIDDELQQVPALSFSCGAEFQTLSFYSYFFYLDSSAQLKALDALSNIKPKPPYQEFADRVVADLGEFNSVHIRRGDFKATIGVTTLIRTGDEALVAMDLHFSRSDTLVILTDEAEDPFFDVIKEAYPKCIFIDHYILENYGEAFADLPMHDSIALAYLSQLIAAQSRDFIGTMTSTFTALVQRMRGNSGKAELFKFLWNEVPPVDAVLEPGKHVKSDDIRLDRSVMVDDFEGPYSWNRITHRFNPAWMREWPEAFLDEAAMLERAAARDYDTNGAKMAQLVPAAATQSLGIEFLGETVEVRADYDSNHQMLKRMFAAMETDVETSPISQVRLKGVSSSTQLLVNDEPVGPVGEGNRALRRAYREVVRSFIHQRSDLVWLHAGAAAGAKGAIVFCAPWGHGKSTLTLQLYERGWSFLSDDVVPIDPTSQVAHPFPATPQMRMGPQTQLVRSQVSTLPKTVVDLETDRVAHGGNGVAMYVFPKYSKTDETFLEPISPAQCVGKLLENSLSFPENSDATIQALCHQVENTPAYELHFADPVQAIDQLLDKLES